MGSNRSKPEMASLTNLAIQAMVMVDCDPAADYSIRGYRPMSWTRKESFLGFMERSFPIDPNPSMNQKVEIALEEKTALKAWKLQKRLNVTFLGTNNISEHLLFDPKENYLYIFHHVGFLKAHLEMAREHGYPLDQSMADSLQKGTLPPQLLVETLHSVQSILFPSIDRKSVPILDDLIANQDTAFDRECADYDGYGLFQEPPAGFSYLYWGDRLALLHELVISRPPRNKLERWLHRQSNEGNALFIALVALLISIFVGILSIGIGAVQIWIAWMAWKYPLTDSSG
ncbi:hypothetical protein CkaCkLH20_04013 [Colletotrichum karsti]|uniref:Uncharacterized protein n=1 Tax=Colletotrichum karsti TaxID=1095194 RepID=A0A9P6LMT8_9PEZI|nr:uncharacterized protein CkaCkLH20_04013 [Colletotrichum karsti]KAF9878521.1 hypothetical protein CkaCkLH20_04013 [Colletotrichum karsti]